LKCCVPLAGPDIYTEKFGLKPAHEIDGVPLLVKAIHSRNWYGKTLFEKDLIFIMRDFEFVNDLQSLIRDNFPNGKQIVISHVTSGALMSAMAGVSLIENCNEPIVVDLVDILFKSQFDPELLFSENISIEGIIPFFTSNNPQYSYLLIDDNLHVTKTREKDVISNNASAGVYFFKNINSFLDATIYSINNFQEVSYNGLHFLCPAFNGLINKGNIVKAVDVTNVNPVSSFFKIN